MVDAAVSEIQLVNQMYAANDRRRRTQYSNISPIASQAQVVLRVLKLVNVPEAREVTEQLLAHRFDPARTAAFYAMVCQIFSMFVTNSIIIGGSIRVLGDRTRSMSDIKQCIAEAPPSFFNTVAYDLGHLTYIMSSSTFSLAPTGEIHLSAVPLMIFTVPHQKGRPAAKTILAPDHKTAAAQLVATDQANADDLVISFASVGLGHEAARHGCVKRMSYAFSLKLPWDAWRMVIRNDLTCSYMMGMTSKRFRANIEDGHEIWNQLFITWEWRNVKGKRVHARALPHIGWLERAKFTREIFLSIIAVTAR